ncbi:MAG: AMP-binding protein, partial [bacterium]|nr:AMP-binding protein [bacterium]
QVERFFTRTQCTLENQYGPSECHVVSYYPLRGAPGRWPPLPPIGRGIGNFRIYLLDARLQPVPMGVPGEVCLSGAGLARGYLRRPEVTAGSFVPDPFSAGARLYRTGDLARFLAGGNLEFMGRIDLQVKIRGFRIEPGEIETVLAWHPGVQEAVVMVREEAPGVRLLVAYAVRTPEAGALDAVELDARELRSFLGERLPDYMVPSAVVFLEALPWTPGGKVDRKALPAPERRGPEEDFTAPRNPSEELLAGIWTTVLGRERAGVDDNFFELGGHSLLATQVVSRIRELFGVTLPVRAVFETPTIAGLATALGQARELPLGAVDPEPPLVRATRAGDPPASFAQQRLWFIDRLAPENPFYSMYSAFRLEGTLDVAALRRAFAEIVRRHENLRTTFRSVAGEPRQVIAPPLSPPLSPPPLPVVDLGALPALRREAEVVRLSAAESRRPFDLTRGPLLRVTLVRSAGTPDRAEHVLFLNLHHIITDGWSTAIFAREMVALYEAFAQGAPSPLAELELQYADFAVWQQQWLRGGALERQLGYWRRQLAGAPEFLDLPLDHPRPAIETFQGSAAALGVPAPVVRGLNALGRSSGTTPSMTLLAAFKTLLSRYSGQTDVVVGTAIANRNRSETEELIGFFVNTLV